MKKGEKFDGFVVEAAPASNLTMRVRVKVRSKKEVINLQRRRFEILGFVTGSFEELPDG